MPRLWSGKNAAQSCFKEKLTLTNTDRYYKNKSYNNIKA